jgi:hypothetical protein
MSCLKFTSDFPWFLKIFFILNFKSFSYFRKTNKKKIQDSVEQTRNVFFKRKTLRELDDQLPKFPWSTFFIEGLYGRLNEKINASEQILVYNWDYLVKMADLFDYYQTNNKRFGYIIFKTESF